MNIFDTKVISNKMITSNYLELIVKSDFKTHELGQPGQFYELQIPEKDFNLRAPISIYSIKDNNIIFLVKIIGEKTKSIQKLKKNDTLNLIGPLGNSFKTHENRKYLLISGGCGYAPLNFLYNESIKSNDIVWIHGGRNIDEVSFSENRPENLIICTEDGSTGHKGFVTEQVLEVLKKNKFDCVFSCGPVPMLKSLLTICKQKKIPLTVSLEEYMACGVGVCYGCAVKVVNIFGKTDYVRVCKEGPIFDAYSIVWEE